MSDDEDNVAGAESHAPFDPAQRTIHASIQFYAQNQYYSQLRALCKRELASNANDSLLQFWYAFASHKEGDHDASIETLTPLAENKDLSLAAVALLLTAHNSRANKDKKLLLELKAKLKVVSKQSTEASLQLAGRYFLYTNKIPKAKQCIEKLIAKDKKNIELLSLFGWIYLQSNEEKYIEKSMQVFKKAAKLSIPNFDIASLLGRAKYFEQDGKISKAIQALDSIIKIYPHFIPAVEEKLRLTALSGKWKDLAKIRNEIGNRRAAVLGDGARDGSLTVSYVNALEKFLQDGASEKAQLSALQELQAVLIREEKNSPYWVWQYVQLFTRLARKQAVPAANKNNTVLQFLQEWIAKPVEQSAKQKSGVNMNYLYEASYVAYTRGEFDRAAEGFKQVADAVLATEKAEKDDDDKGGEAKEGKVNEEERYQKSQAALHLILIQLQQGQTQEAKAALAAVPQEYQVNPPSPHAAEGTPPTPTNSYLLTQAWLSWVDGKDFAATTAKLTEFLDAHMHAMKERSVSDGIINTASANGVQGINKYFICFDPLLFVQATQLFLQVCNVPFDAATGAIQANAVRPTDVSGDLVTQFVTALRHFTSLNVFPGCSAAWNLQAIIAWIEGDMEAASQALEKVEQIDGAKEARVPALKQLIQGGVASGVMPTPRKPAAASASSSSSSIPADNAPSTAQRKQFRAALGEEVGLNFDDDEEDVDALFKDAEEANEDKRKAEDEAQALLDEMEARAKENAKKREADLRAAEETRVAKEAQRKKQMEEMNKAAEVEAKLALEKASKKDLKLAEQRKQEEIAQLRQMREAEKKRKEEELERAEREREEQRERDRQDRMRQRDEVTTVQAFSGPDASSQPYNNAAQAKKPTQMKWNFPNDSPSPSPSASTGLTPLSLQSNGGNFPAGSPLSNTSSIGHHAQFRQSPTNGGGYASSSPTNVSSSQQQQQQQQQMQPGQQMTQQQLAHQRQLELQRSEESRALQEKKDKIMQAGLQIDQAKKFTKVAFWGEVFLKHGRRGSPHERNVTLEVTGSELKFDWSSGQLKAHKNDIQLVEGKGTPVFHRPTAEKSKADRCFSIVTANRTLDLEAPTDQARDYWVTGIKLLLKYLK